MTISAIDLFSVGIGPSSSHTVGPMRAAARFIQLLEDAGEPATHIVVELRGSLAATGKGHGTDRAVLMGLMGYSPESIPVDASPAYGDIIPTTGTLPNGASYEISFEIEPLAEHPNALVFHCGNSSETYFSVGGGFILSSKEYRAQHGPAGLGAGVATTNRASTIPYYFTSGARLLQLCHRSGKSIAEIMAANEAELHGAEKVAEHLDRVWDTMRACVSAGISTTGILPGGLEVERRAPGIYQHLLRTNSNTTPDAFGAMEWVNLYALAVNEENAAGGRVVTAPTNGAAGIIPAVMHYARDFLPEFTRSRAREFLLTAGAIGVIIKENASISGAEVGCQGEVGSAAAMAAAALTELLGGTPEQAINAAEIALEHNLGLTCDPVGGLVQIPCIERNAIAAVQAINAARLANLGTGVHHVSLDDCIRVMADTGRDMMSKYKETSLGGLAIQIGMPVNLTSC
ncbi:L-serine ammonia-lyase [Corynebacterium sp. H128]|uniref:L-serine ammonia-lyase n=1 Tax=Corynebacterium sp. H128 TaxID=3133427 RepID=UPI0030B063C7